MVWMSEFIASSWARIFEKSSSLAFMISVGSGSGVSMLLLWSGFLVGGEVGKAGD